MEHLTNKDFSSDQEVRWCPGCGDYAILRSMQKALPQLERKKEDLYLSLYYVLSFPLLYGHVWFSFYSWQSPAFAVEMKR